MTNNKLIEVMAREIEYETRYGKLKSPVESSEEITERQAQAALKAIEAAGFVVLSPEQQRERAAILSEAYSGNPAKPLRNAAIKNAMITASQQETES